MQRRVVQAAVFLALGVAAVQAASLRENIARTAALREELELWSRAISAGSRLDGGVLASLIEVKRSYPSPSESAADSPSLTIEENAMEPLRVKGAAPGAVTVPLKIRKKPEPKPAPQPEGRKGLLQQLRALVRPNSFLEVDEDEDKDAPGKRAVAGPLKYKDVQWTEDGEWRAAFANGDLSTDPDEVRSSDADGSGVGSDEGGSGVDPDDDAFGADGAPDDSDLPEDNQGQPNAAAASSASELSAEFKMLLALREEAGAPSYRSTMARARAVHASFCPDRALRCLQRCHSNATRCNMEASNGDPKLQRPSPFKRPAGYDDVPAATPEEDLGMGSDKNVDSGQGSGSEQSVVEGEIMPQEDLAKPADPYWAEDPMFGGKKKKQGITIVVNVTEPEIKPTRPATAEAVEEEAETTKSESEKAVENALAAAKADPGSGSGSGSGNGSGSGAGSGSGSGAGSGAAAGDRAPAPEALQMVEEAAVEGEADFRKAGSVSKGMA